MADPADSVELALSDLENEPLPTHTRDHSTRPQDDDIEIAHAEDEGGDAPTAAPTREIPAEEGIAELRARLQSTDTARRQAEERANQAERARTEAIGSAQDANVQFLTSALEGVRQSMGVLEANLAEAYAVQDFGAAAKIQTEIARTAQRESAIEGGLEQLKSQPREQPRQAPPRQDDPVEAVARQLTPNAAAWIRQHPDYITDPQKNARLMSAHYDAMANGLPADSPDYINFVEDRVLQRQPARRDPEPQPERREPVADTRRSAPPAAPVSRGNGGASNPTRVTLSREERDTAHENFPDEMREDPSGRKAEQAYARNRLILQREGRMKVN
jgi:hypothetical protein